jgi:hypothetical protein
MGGVVVAVLEVGKELTLVGEFLAKREASLSSAHEKAHHTHAHAFRLRSKREFFLVEEVTYGAFETCFLVQVDTGAFDGV